MAEVPDPDPVHRDPGSAAPAAGGLPGIPGSLARRGGAANLPAPLPYVLIDSWERELGGQQGVHAAVWGAHWASDPALDELRPGLVARFRDFGARLSPEVRERWLLEVQNGLGPEQASNWAEITGQESPKRRGLRFRGKET